MRGALRAAQKAISQMSHFWIREVRSDLVFARCQDLKCLTTITASAVQRWKPSSSTSGEVVMVKEECELNVLAIFFIAHMIAIIVTIIVYLLPIRGVGEVQVCPRCEVIVSLPIQSSTVSWGGVEVAGGKEGWPGCEGKCCCATGTFNPPPNRLTPYQTVFFLCKDFHRPCRSQKSFCAHQRKCFFL